MHSLSDVNWVRFQFGQALLTSRFSCHFPLPERKGFFMVCADNSMEVSQDTCTRV
jgi:hypothetical protein